MDICDCICRATRLPKIQERSGRVTGTKGGKGGRTELGVRHLRAVPISWVVELHSLLPVCIFSCAGG